MLKPKPIEPGAIAPDFSYTTAEGETLSTVDLRGHPYLVYFYPKDDTPGCTREACGFRDSYQVFRGAGIEIIGVSADGEESHQKFRKKHQLPFPLSADTAKTVCRHFGVWGEKKFMGKTFEGVHRMSFLIGPDGRVAKTYQKVKPAEHAGEVLDDVSSLFSS